MDKPLSYYAFEMLYWCGIREGELLALTPADFDFHNQTVTINKSYQRLKGRDVITSPKTKKSNRVVKMPQFLSEEMEDCMKLYYSLKPTDRLFPVTKHYLSHEMDRGCKAAGVKRIRIHDLRHPYVKHTTKKKIAEISDYRSNSPRFYYTNFVDIIISHERMNSFYLPLYLCGAFPE